MFVGVFAVTLQGLSKNGRGSREAGGEVAPFYVAKWHGAVHWYKFRNLIRRLRRHLLPFLEKALNALHLVTSTTPINQNFPFYSFTTMGERFLFSFRNDKLMFVGEFVKRN